MMYGQLKNRNNRLMILALIFFTSSCSLPSYEAWVQQHQSSYAIFLDKEGHILQVSRKNFQHKTLPYFYLKDVPSTFIEQLVLAEDKYFFSHPGVNPLAWISSVVDYLKRQKKRGASTLTQQLVSLLHPQIKKNHPVIYKTKQILLALFLEHQWTKDQILEAYLNGVSFGGETTGLLAASLHYYGKIPALLHPHESLWLLSHLPGPSQSYDLKQKRACAYLKNWKPGTSCLDLDQFAPSLSPLPWKNVAPHISNEFRETGIIQTTLDKHLQDSFQQLLDQHIKLLSTQNVKDGALLVVERKTGKILSYIGGSTYSSSSINHLRAKRQAGSTLKPFLFAEAIEKKILTMNSPLLDAPFEVEGQQNMMYRPGNYHRSYLHRAVPVKEALASSLNTPAVRAIDLITPQNFYHVLKKWGFNLEFDESFFGHSLALGSLDVSLWELVQAYGQLAQASHFHPILRSINISAQKEKISPISPEVSFIIQHILSEKSYRVHTFGLHSILSAPYWLAAKTGTSKDMRDNWCIGFSEDYVVGTWVGNSTGEPMWNVSGITGAAPLFRAVMDELHQHKISKSPLAPSTLIKHQDNYFLPGTEPLLALKRSLNVAKILHPTDGSVYSFDPEIPTHHQKIKLKASSTRSQWRVNNQLIDQDEWLINKSGKFKLELLDQELKVIDQVTFQVRK